MLVLVDTTCFPDITDPSCLTLQQICEKNNVVVEFKEMPTAGESAHRKDIIGLLSLGVATLTLIVAMLQLSSMDKDITQRAILGEIDAYLRLRGISDYRFTFVDGIENLIARNGRPCIVMVSFPAGETAPLYIGATKERVFVSATLYDWRALT